VWRLFAVPERELGVLGDVRDVDVLELACGTAYCSAWLSRAGARTVAVDLSAEQLATARNLQDRIGPAFPLVLADAERAPFASESFDLVVSEQGSLRGAARSVGCPRRRGNAAAARLAGDLQGALAGRGIEFHPSHGDWIRLLRGSGFVVEALHEIFAPPGSAEPPLYGIVSAEWATRWPAEELWVASRR
jgi:SAM-dependent methyltransferase